MIELGNECYIRVFSTTNYWLDCIFIVSPRDQAAAVAVLRCAYNDFWDEETDECYGDYFCRRLDEAEIDYCVFYAPDEED